MNEHGRREQGEGGPGAYLAPTDFVDSAAENVVAFARRACADASDEVSRAVRLFYAVRDEIVYTPYCDFRSPETFRASACLARGAGFCVAKAALLAAAARAVGIPARVGFADVRNRALMGTDLFYYHGYAELHLAGRWVKATPAFDRGLCERFGVRPLEFEGREDALFHPYDVAGRRHMEYVRDRGAEADVPVAAIVANFARAYPAFMAEDAPASATQFRREAEEAGGGERPA
jgi:transglutaminase-like putative cysteine protease